MTEEIAKELPEIKLSLWHIQTTVEKGMMALETFQKRLLDLRKGRWRGEQLIHPETDFEEIARIYKGIYFEEMQPFIERTLIDVASLGNLVSVLTRRVNQIENMVQALAVEKKVAETKKKEVMPVDYQQFKGEPKPVPVDYREFKNDPEHREKPAR